VKKTQKYLNNFFHGIFTHSLFLFHLIFDEKLLVFFAGVSQYFLLCSLKLKIDEIYFICGRYKHIIVIASTKQFAANFFVGEKVS
jgi:hypothetical protein